LAVLPELEEPDLLPADEPPDDAALAPPPPVERWPTEPEEPPWV